MSASDDLARYLHLHRSGKIPPHSPDHDKDSIATSDLLSEISSDFSESALKPRKPWAYLPPRHAKHPHRQHSGSHLRSALKPVLEEEDAFSISAFLPDSKSPSKQRFLSYRHSSKRKSASKPTISKEFDENYSVASIDTEALLRSSDEEMEENREMTLPRQMPKTGLKHIARNKAKAREDTRSTPNLKFEKGKLMEEIREKVREMTRQARVELKIPARSELASQASKVYIDELYNTRREVPEREHLGISHPSKSTQESIYPPSSAYNPSKPKVSLSLETQKLSHFPSSRLELASVCSISILPKFNMHSTGSDFSLLDQFQSPASRKSHVNDSSLMRSLRASREQGKLAVSPKFQHRQRMSIVQAVVLIQRAVRKYVLKGNSRPIKPSVPAIKAYENWSSDLNYRLPPTLKRRLEEQLPGLPDPERATQSLYKALDQLTALRSMASRSSSEDTSLVLSESLETTQGGKGRISAKSKETSDLRKPKSPEELDLSGDTDFLLRSSESLDLME
jgi:hypothetical protein